MAVKLIRMVIVYPETGEQKFGDIHPNEVEHMREHGWQIVSELPKFPPEPKAEGGAPPPKEDETTLADLDAMEAAAEESAYEDVPAEQLEAEAKADGIDIPPDWETWHHTKKRAFAKKLDPSFTGGKDEAEAVIRRMEGGRNG